MFDIGWGELVVIGIIALIVIGPKELPTVLRTLGQAIGKVKRMANEFQGQFQEALREAELTDLKKHAEDLTSDFSRSVSEFSDFDPMAETQNEIEQALEAPTAAEAAKIETSASKPGAENAAPAAEAPVANEDFASAEPPAKPAGGSA